METHRKTATLAGILYIVGTVTGVLSVVFTGSILDGPDYLANTSVNANQVILGALFVLIMGLALAMVPVVVYPISKRHSETLALGYVLFRGTLETVTYIAVVISSLLLVTLSREFVVAGARDGSGFHALGAVLLRSNDWISQIQYITDLQTDAQKWTESRQFGFEMPSKIVHNKTILPAFLIMLTKS